MIEKSLVFRAFVHALAVLVYIMFVGYIMRYGEKIFGNTTPNFVGPVAFLLLFVVSATVTASLVFGRPVLMYMDGMKKDALRLFLYTLAWMVLFLGVIFVFSAFI